MVGNKNRVALNMQGLVLGEMLCDTHCVHTGTRILVDSCFDGMNKSVWATMQEMYIDGKDIDIVTVVHAMSGQGDFLGKRDLALYLSGLTMSVASTAHFDSHCMCLLEYAIGRRLADLGIELYNEPRTDDMTEGVSKPVAADALTMLDYADGVLQEIKLRIASLKERDMAFYIAESQKENEGKAMPWVDLSFVQIIPGNLIVVAGVPGMGKTAFVLNIIQRMKLNALLFSYEMTGVEIINRLRKNMAIEDIGGMKLKIMDGALPLPTLMAKVREEKAKGCELVAIDFLQLMSSGDEWSNNRTQDVSTVVRGLKNLAKECGVPIIVLSQLSRRVNERINKRPILSDLKETGAIEESADVVMFLWRPSEYKLDSFVFRGEEIETGNQCLVDVAKARNFKKGEGLLAFNDDKQQFFDLARQAEELPF